MRHRHGRGVRTAEGPHGSDPNEDPQAKQGPAPTAGDDRFVAALTKARVIAIVRGPYQVPQYAEIVDALVEGGLSLVELTVEQPHAVEAIRRLAPQLPRDVWLGAGTVRTIEHAERAVEAGARFLVSPSFDAGVARFAKEADVPYLPGVQTPTEVDAARAAGCSAVKLFPAHHLGPTYLKAIKAPLHDVNFVPTGGIGPEDANTWISAGACAVGVGGFLVAPGDAPSEIRERAQAMVEALKGEKTDG
ncbi:MAG: bifunctional 4-hydroxy-2-oxoglutarate aldolase/2-dehydro-3-deoxy-phosphogluconate aldolase [Trueperaceae bacterium]|nr:bifunctional 4-hydroxy-2-oxoglutarate aldolase/2-dehydro-3-deoxy-phosphogluconate aldolase [Trueperaceae bacterium]